MNDISSSRPWLSRTFVDDRETVLLAKYAMFSRDSLGRRRPEPPHPYRGPFQRDRDRILHSSAYRRLSGKMQVFTGEMGDYHRTRLTHTQEVATTARTIGRALRLNEDLIEALALMHDIGHPPYGHCGEDALDEVMRPYGGFSHNRFALTIVEEMEFRYQRHPGLNLTAEVLAGQADRTEKNKLDRSSLLEVQLVDAADSTAYDAHDTDDAIKLGLVTLDQLQQVPLIHECVEQVREHYSELSERFLSKAVVHHLVNWQVTDMIEHNARELQQRDFQSSAEAMSSGFRIGPSPELAEKKRVLEGFLFQNVYRHPKLIAVRQQAHDKIQTLWRLYVEDPSRLPKKYQIRAEHIGIHAMAGHYIAGMTDRFFEDTYRLMVHSR
ncbi:MAG: dNTP triphosphohydrolase [Planctomycetaceae bacterium]|nr:dNTP triphosphohydrolase [Planctomycetaceae bacterium]